MKRKQEANGIKIEKGVPIGQAADPRGRPLKYPFDRMDVGDSILGDKKAREAARKYGQSHAEQFLSRADGDQYRIWRIA